MAQRRKGGAEKYHDRVASIYDGIYAGSAYWDFYWTLTWRHVKKYLPNRIPCRALDVGCGTGRWGLKLLKSGFHSDFLDISEKMLQQVSKKLASERLNYDPQLFHASIDDLTALESESYGVIIGQGDPLSCAQNPRRAMKEMSRLLEPEGVMVMSVDNRLAGLDHFLEKNDLDGLERFLKDGKTEWLTDSLEERFPLTMFTPNGITKLYEENGLEVLSIIGKTVLPIREIDRNKKNQMLEDSKTAKRLMKIEESLNSDPAMLSRAAHLEIIGRKKKIN